MTDPSGYLPPHELRSLSTSLVDRDAAPTTNVPTPGIGPAAAAPTGFTPTLPGEDPALALLLAQVLDGTGGSVVPVSPTQTIPSGPAVPTPGLAPALPIAIAGIPEPLLSPGITPTLEPMGAGIAPVIVPMTPAAAASPQPPSTQSPRELGDELRIPFGDEMRGSSSSAPPPAPPPAPPWSRELGDDMRVPLIGDQLPTVEVHDDVRVPFIGDDQATAMPRRDTRAPLTETPIRESSSGAFDPYAARADVPILSERVHGKRLVWLDNAATTQKPRAVIDRIAHFYEHENSNVHRAAHALAARATDAYEGARETTRKFLNAPSASEIIFVRGATEGINLIAKTWGKRHVERGDEILITHLEHHANIVPWQQLCAEVGATLRVAPVDDRGDVILEEYERLMCSCTKLVAFTQVSNALGTVTPAREMIEIAHRWGATVVLDGAQAVSHMPVDVQTLDCDFYVFSGHKVFAPTGIGAVFGKRALLEAMPPWQGGGNMIADVTFERTVYQAPPWRFEAGTGNIADAAGLGTALDYVMRIGMPTIERYEHELLGYATEQLATVRGLAVIGTPRHRAGVLSFVLDGKRTEDVGSALDKEGIAVRSGHHCAQPILRRFGVESSVRASLAFYNVREDIDALTEALRRIQASV
ncbi:MAG: family 2A encapsulin nanocompartment cargo protein cysteine desulfurase [Kofleriaceae bacterium]